MDSVTSTAPPPINRTTRRTVITTWGSFGDLHPYVALALGLKSRGYEAILATGECYRQKIEALGLGFRPVRPDSDWVTDPVEMRRLMHQRWGVIRVVRTQLLSVRASYEDTLAAAEGCDLIVGNMAVYTTGIVAEKLQIPWISAIHIPTGMFSAYDPPLIPGFPEISKKLRCLGPRFWGPFGRSINWIARGLARPWHRLRKELGLPPVRGINPLTESHSPVLHLALFSRWLVNKQRDWPAQTIVTGFPWFDADGGAGLPEQLVHFLDDGEPPLVFTLGTVVVADPGDFYHQSVAAAKMLGRRAILLVKNPRAVLPDLPAGIVAFSYAPFSQLFPRVAAIIHHGGIGTTGQVIRSGRPSLVMPCAWDQPDNAERVARLGIARIIARNRYEPLRVTAELRRLLEDPGYSQRAAEIATKVRQEDGVTVACDALESMFQR